MAGEEAEDEVNRGMAYSDDDAYFRQIEGKEKHRADLRERKRLWLEEKARRKTEHQRENGK